MRNCSFWWLATIVLCLALEPISISQVATGMPQFNSLGGGPFDRVNLGNLNVHFTIPIINKGGRGTPFTYNLAYDSSIWVPVTVSGNLVWQPTPNWGWQGQTEVSLGYITMTSTTTKPLSCGDGTFASTTIYFWKSYRDNLGASHSFGLASTNVNGCAGSESSKTAPAVDGSGYILNASGNTASITSPTGAVIYAPANNQNGSGTFTDTNGNRITVNSTGSFTDTFGTNVLTISGSGTPTSPLKFKYKNPSAGDSYFTINYGSYPIKTAFGCNGVGDYTSTSNISLASNVQLPDGSKYILDYEKTPGNPSYYTGRLLSVQLPSGGTITYGYNYNDGHNGIVCADGSTDGLTRTLNPGAKWTYVRTQDANVTTHWTTLVTTPSDPANSPQVGNDTVIDFQKDVTANSNSFYEVQRQIYQGSSSGGTLLLTLLTCYNANYSCTPTSSVSSPITQLDAYRKVPNGATSKLALSETLWNGPFLTADNEYDYGVQLGAAPSSTYLISGTQISYASLGNGIVDRPSQITVRKGATIVSQVSYTYDEGTPTATQNTPQHTSITGARGNPTTISRLVSTGNTLNQHFTYYDTGNENTSQDANGAITTTKYGACGNSLPTEVDLPLSLTTYLTWDANCYGAVITSLKDFNGNPTSYTYADANYWRRTGVSFPDGGATTYTFNTSTSTPWSVNQSSKKDTSNNVVSAAIMDGFGRVQSAQLTSDPNGTAQVVTTFDNLGRVASVTNPYYTTADPTYGLTQYIYDALGRWKTLSNPDNTQIQFSYSGSAAQLQDEGNNTGGTTHINKVFQYDGQGRLASVCEVSSTTQQGGSNNVPTACGQDIPASGFLTSYGYDALSRLTSVNQAGLGSRTYAYDDLSRLKQEVDPEAGTTTYTYDTGTAGDAYQRVRPRQNQTGTATVTTTFTFDQMHRLTGLNYNDGSTPSVALSYDQNSVSGITLANYKGHLTSAVAAGGGTRSILSYDVLGRIAKEWQCTPLNCGSGNVSLQYGYNYLGDTISLVNSEEGITYTYSYDNADRLTMFQSSLSDSNHPGTLLTVNQYNALGEMVKSTLGNGLIQNIGYDNRGRLNSLSDGSIYSFVLGYAPDGDILSANDSVNGNWTYAYDDFDRLSSANKNSGQQTFTYAYDRYGNRWKQNAPQGGPAPQYTFNGNNQIAGSGVLYDSAGNVTNDGLGNGYAYDAEGRLTGVTGSSSSSYVYDAFGRRARVTVGGNSHDFVFNRDGVAVDDVTATGWVRGELYVGGLHLGTYANSTTYFDHSDWLGTVRAWSNPAASRVGTCTDLPFGDTVACTGTSPSPLNFTGEILDPESNLTHFWFRQLSTTEARWTAPDPAGMAAIDLSDPRTLDQYTYAVNNPCLVVDPLGLKPKCTLTVNLNYAFPLSNAAQAAVQSTLKNLFGPDVGLQFVSSGSAADLNVNISSIAASGVGVDARDYLGGTPSDAQGNPLNYSFVDFGGMVFLQELHNAGNIALGSAIGRTAAHEMGHQLYLADREQAWGNNIMYNDRKTGGAMDPFAPTSFLPQDSINILNRCLTLRKKPSGGEGGGQKSSSGGGASGGCQQILLSLRSREGTIIYKWVVIC